MATIPSVQLFRNSNIISGRSAAIDTLERKKKYVPDGGLILATYSSDNGVKTLLGIVRNSGSENAQITIMDVEGAAENVQKTIEKAINDLNKEDTAVVGQYVSSVSEENGIIKVTRQELPSFGEKSNIGKAITAITQTNGLVDVQFGGVAAANVSVADEGNKFTATTVEGALSEIHTSLNEAMRSVGMIIDGKINAINSSKSWASQHITVGVNQNHGVITLVTVREDNIASASLLGTTSDTKDNETAFGYIAKEVADRTAAIEALSTSSTVTLESVDETEGFLKVYTIKQGKREVGKINIPKDLVVTSGSVVKGTWDGNTFTEDVSGSGTSTGTALKLVIANQTNPVYINTLDLVKDHTGGNGIAISETNVISVKIDGDSESFLTVGENGVKLSGVQAAINKANTKVAKDSGADKITLSDSTAADGSVTYTIGQNDIASEAALTAEVSARQSADTKLQNNIDNVNSTIESYGHVTSQALNDLGTRMDDYGQVTSQALNDLGTKFGDYYTKTEVDSKDATINATIEALSSDTKNKIDAEASARQEADNTLQGNINNVNSSLTAHIANTTVHVTQADKDKWNTPTDLSNYYTKEEVDEKDTAINATIEAYGHVTSQALNDLGTRMDDYGQVTSQALNDLGTKFGDYYTKTEVDSKDATINATIEALDGSLGDTVSTTVASGEYSSTDKAIYLKNISGKTLSTIDATNFIKDGMVSNVEVADGNLKISFNTDAGHEDINIPISAIFNANNYYTKTEIDTKVDDINSQLSEYGQTTSQALNDLATRLTEETSARESGDTTLQNNINALSSDTKTKIDAEAQARTSGDTTLQGNIDALSSSTDTKIANETTARQEADTTLQTNINNVNSSLTAHTANTTVHVTQADKDKWNTPTDLSNYYTKTEVNSKVNDINSTIESYGQVTSQALNDLGTRLDDYGKVTSQSLNDLSTKFGDYYTKTEVDTAIANVDVTGQLQNYYTKTEVDSKDATIQTSINALSGDTKTKIDEEIAARESGDNALQTAINALDAHVSENEDIVSQSLNDLNNRIGENEDIVAQSLNDLNNRIGDTYVKSYIDALEARIAELEARFLNMENNGIETGEY